MSKESIQINSINLEVHGVVNVGNSTRQRILQILLGVATTAWLIFCLYLSWQPGEETVQFTQRIARFLLDLLGRLGLQPDARQFHAGLRLFAHFGVFYVTGLLTTAALYVSLPRDKHRMGFCIAAGLCSLVAVLVEAGKLAVPGRHLTWSEAGLNVLGTLAGMAVANAIQWLIRNVRENV